MSGATVSMMAGSLYRASAAAPTLVSSTINTAGTSLTDVYSASVSHGAGGSGGKAMTMSGGAVTPTYSSGAGSTTLVYTLSRTVNSGETGTSAYTQPGNGIEATTGGTDVATYSGATVTNNSTAGSAIALRSSTKGRTATSTVSGDAAVTVVAGDTVFATFVFDNGATEPTTVTDSGGNVLAKARATYTSSNSKMVVYYASNVTNAGSLTLSATFTGSPFCFMAYGSISGAATASLDLANTPTNSASTPIAQATGTLGQADELILVLVKSNSVSGTTDYTQSGGPTLTQMQEEPDAANYWTGALFYYVVASTSTTSPSVACSTLGGDIAMQIVTFKKA